MNSSNKLSLKQFIKMDQSKELQNTKLNQRNQENGETRQIKNERRSSAKENKKLKLNTLPCEQIQNDQNQSQKFLFRSTWEGDIQHFKQQMKCMPGGCTSPTFATQILSHVNTNSNLFPMQDRIEQQNNTMSNSRSKSKSKNNKSLQKFIGDNAATHRPVNSTLQKGTKQRIKIQNSSYDENLQSHLYEFTKLESINHELKRQNKTIKDKYDQIRIKYQKLQEENQKINQIQNKKGSMTEMSNDQLIQKMKNQSFWKFYLKAEKLIRSSSLENNQQSTSPINFMKQLEALRQMTSEMKKQNKVLKKSLQQNSQQLQSFKDKTSVQEAEIQQMRLKCVAYQSTIRKMKDEITGYRKQAQKGSKVNELQSKLSLMFNQNSKLSKQTSSLRQQLQEQKALNSQCQKQRVSIKKKYQQSQQQLSSLNKQLSSLKTNYNLLEIERQQKSANKKQLIEKQKLKQKIHQLQKQIKSLASIKENQTMRIKQEYEQKYSKQISLKDSQTKELDQKIEKIVFNMNEVQKQNQSYSETNQKLSQKLRNIESDYEKVELELRCVKKEKESKLNEFSLELTQLNKRLKEQNDSIQTQSELINQLKKQINQKQELIRENQYESQKLKQSLMMIKEESKVSQSSVDPSYVNHLSSQNSSRQHANEYNISRNFLKRNFGQQKNQEQYERSLQKISELEDYICKLQQKHNQALELYEKVSNQKNQLQLQIQYFQQKFNYIDRQSQRNNKCERRILQEQKADTILTEQVIELVQSLLTIKEQIIKKILVFCPLEYKQLLIEYIYYGDMIKEKYLQLICNQQNHQQHCIENQDEQDSCSEEQCTDSQYEDSKQNRTLPNKNRRNNKQYNKTQSFIPRKQMNNQHNASEDQFQNNQTLYEQKEQALNQLMQKFIRIGKIIQKQTKKTYTTQRNRSKQPNNIKYKKLNHQSFQKQQPNFNSKEKYSKRQNLSKNSKQIYPQNQNTIYQNPSQSKNKKGTNVKNILAENQYSNNDRKYREPLQSIEQGPDSNNRHQYSKRNMKINEYSNRQDSHTGQNKSQKPLQYQKQRQYRKKMINNYTIDQSSMTPNQQSSYHKNDQHKIITKNNFNHGIINNVNLLKMIDRIKQN